MMRARAVALPLLLIGVALFVGLRCAAFVAPRGEAGPRALRTLRHAAGAARVTKIDEQGRVRFVVPEPAGKEAVPSKGPVLPTSLDKSKFILAATATFALSLWENAIGFFNAVTPEWAEAAQASTGAIETQLPGLVAVVPGIAAVGASLTAVPRFLEERSGRGFVQLVTAFFFASLVVNSAGFFNPGTAVSAEVGQDVESWTRQLAIFVLSFAGPVSFVAPLVATAPSAAGATTKPRGIKRERIVVAFTALFLAAAVANSCGFFSPDASFKPDMEREVGSIVSSLLGIQSALFICFALFKSLPRFYIFRTEVSDWSYDNSKFFLGLNVLFVGSFVASPLFFP